MAKGFPPIQVTSCWRHSSLPQSAISVCLWMQFRYARGRSHAATIKRVHSEQSYERFGLQERWCIQGIAERIAFMQDLLD